MPEGVVDAAACFAAGLIGFTGRPMMQQVCFKIKAQTESHALTIVGSTVVHNSRRRNTSRTKCNANISITASHPFF